MTTQYPEILAALLEKIDSYRRQELSLSQIKTALWNASGIISAYEERALREALQRAEGQLELVQFTIGETEVRNESLKIIDALEARIRASMVR